MACNGGDNASWRNVLAQAEQGWPDVEERPRKWTKGRWF